MLGLNGEKRLIVGLGHIVMTQLGMTESTEIEGSKIAIVLSQHVAIFFSGIFPLAQVDIGLGLTQFEVDILRILPDGFNEHRYGIAPLL